ncbi:MAG: hypothetical protein BWK75_02100 [Candidatus Altiarchaeales archaeon A3]|nr:MAG: hypothetical protein BWK75_02100 [Candidatus Altiarchaeales archaeon A3]
MKTGCAILGAIVVAGMLLLSGCIGSEGGGFDVNKVIEAQKNIKQYTFESEISYGGAGMGFTMPMNGKVDVENKKIHINMSMMGQNMEMYLIGNEMYMKQAGQWIKMTKSDLERDSSGVSGFGDQANQYEKTTEILKSPKTKIDVVGEETVDGVTCYKVNVVPDVEKLKEQLGKSAGMTRGMEYLINGSSYTIYVDKTTNFIKKEDINSTMEMSAQGMKMNIYMQMKFVYKDLNKPVDIQLPEEVRNAKSMTEMMKEMNATKTKQLLS